ncbi:hypothetical protein HD806DRAFT_65917 [Xylariaceae sp. AK1471]|nr:hypothetical protein HD806DRAFT_65917 [Xylariaceae sp. AK1471]
MASYTSWLGLLANPYRLATLLLGIAACLFTLATIPPSSVAYLIRVDSSNNGDAVALTTWFANRGYCTSNVNTNNVLSPIHSSVHCSSVTPGYDVMTALAQDGTTMVILPESPVLSIFLTRPPVVLHPIAIALSLLSMAAHQVILRRPTAIVYAISMGGSLLAFLISGISLIFEYSFESYIEDGYPAKDTTFTTTLGPMAYAIRLAFVFQLAACVVGFYTCIGGKYHCDRSIRLEDEELAVEVNTAMYNEGAEQVEAHMRGIEKGHGFPLDVKYPL